MKEVETEELRKIVSQLDAFIRAYKPPVPAPTVAPPWTPTVGEWVERNGWEGIVVGLVGSPPASPRYIVMWKVVREGADMPPLCNFYTPSGLRPLWDGNYDPPSELETEFDGKMIPIKHDNEEHIFRNVFFLTEDTNNYVPHYLVGGSGLDAGADELNMGFLPSEAGSAWSENKDPEPAHYCRECRFKSPYMYGCHRHPRGYLGSERVCECFESRYPPPTPTRERNCGTCKWQEAPCDSVSCGGDVRFWKPKDG